MIKTKTVLILGAGASAPYGLPTGGGLRSEIITTARNFLKDRLPDLAAHHLEKKKVENFLSVFEGADLPTVDEFIGNQKTEEERRLTKLLTTFTLLKKENPEKLRRESKEGWYHLLYDSIRPIPGANPSTFKGNNVTIVTFNYDRSLEHFLHSRFASLYKSSDIADSFMQSLPILHTHGQLGSFRWQTSPGIVSVEYGTLPSDLGAVGDGIKTIHEKKDNNEIINQAREKIEAAERIFFVGCGYHEKNMELIGFHKERRGFSLKSIFGTSRGLYPKDRQRINGTYGVVFPQDFSNPMNPFLEVDAAALFTEHHSLSDS